MKLRMLAASKRLVARASIIRPALSRVGRSGVRQSLGVFATKVDPAGRLLFVCQKCPFFDMVIRTVQREGDAVHVAATLAEVGTILELENEFVRIGGGNKGHSG